MADQDTTPETSLTSPEDLGVELFLPQQVVLNIGDITVGSADLPGTIPTTMACLDQETKNEDSIRAELNVAKSIVYLQFGVTAYVAAGAFLVCADEVLNKGPVWQRALWGIAALGSATLSAMSISTIHRVRKGTRVEIQPFSKKLREQNAPLEI